MKALPGALNYFCAPMVAVAAPNSPILVGTVNFYLLALSGPNIGTWFRSDGSWQAVESIAAVGVHKGHGHWMASIAAVAWNAGAQYRLYAAESGGLSITWGLDLLCEGVDLGAGTGTNTVTITVTDTGNPIEGAQIKMTKGLETFSCETNVSGVATLNLNNGTYVLAVTASGYSYLGSEPSISADTDISVEMDETAIPYPSSPTQITAYGTTMDAAGNVEEGIVVQFELMIPTTAGIYGREVLTATSDENGLVTIELLKNANYRFKRSERIPWKSISTGDGDSFDLGSPL